MRSVVALSYSPEARGLGVLLIGLAVIGAVWVVYLIRRNRQDSTGTPSGFADFEFWRDINKQEVHWPGDDDGPVLEAEVVEQRVYGWDGFHPLEVLDQLRRATDGDVSQRLLKWNSLAPLLADPSREMAPEFARLVSRVGTGALAIVGGEPGPTWDACMTGAHRIVTCPALAKPTDVVWDIPRESVDPADVDRHAVRFFEVTG